MILFEHDWLKYPSAIIDETTTNESAKILAGRLKQMGVRNHAFFLALHDRSLQGLDPYDPNLTAEQMTAIGIECFNNPWYFFREVARAPATGGQVGSRVTFNRANISLWWCFFNHITYALIQPRQTGKSFCTDLLMTLLMLIRCSNSQINLMTKDEILRKANIARLKAIYEELPAFLKIKTREDSNNTEALSVKAKGNTYITHVPQPSEKRADMQGRGLTTPVIQWDEAAFQPNISISYPAAMGAMGASIEEAKRNGEPYGVILTTTAGKKDDRDGKFVYSLISESALWSERFYDAANEAQLDEMVRRHSQVRRQKIARKGVDNSTGLLQIYGSFSYRQLGKDDKWMRDQLERQRGTPEAANRDYFNVWTSGAQDAPLPPSLLEKMTNGINDESYQSISSIGGYILRWYIPKDQIEDFMHTRKTVAGIDTSDASGGDGISFVLTDVETGAVVAVAGINETNLIRFAQWLVWWLATYANTTLIIERRSSAVTIIDYLLLMLPERGIDPFKRLFNWVVNDSLEYADRYYEARQPMARRSEDLYVRCKKHFGFATSGSGETSRSALYSTTLYNAASRCGDKLSDRSLTEQITGLVNRNGRVDHAPGEHDDLVIGWLLCHWFLTMTKNLQHYGIEARAVLVAGQQDKPTLTAPEAYVAYEQAMMRQRIEQIFNELNAERDPFICQKLERELRAIDSRLILEVGESFSVDAMLGEIKSQQRVSYASNPYNQKDQYYQRFGYRVQGDAQACVPLRNGTYG